MAAACWLFALFFHTSQNCLSRGCYPQLGTIHSQGYCTYLLQKRLALALAHRLQLHHRLLNLVHSRSLGIWALSLPTRRSRIVRSWRTIIRRAE